MSIPMDSEIVNWTAFSAARSALGADFVRILGYFREDGIASVDAIERAMHEEDARQLVLPAHKLKGESYQFGAERLAELAEYIEEKARICVEHQDKPDELVREVVALRPLFEQTLVALEAEASPLVQRKAGFGNRAAGTNQGFGRL